MLESALLFLLLLGPNWLCRTYFFLLPLIKLCYCLCLSQAILCSGWKESRNNLHKETLAPPKLTIMGLWVVSRQPSLMTWQKITLMHRVGTLLDSGDVQGGDSFVPKVWGITLGTEWALPQVRCEVGAPFGNPGCPGLVTDVRVPGHSTNHAKSLELCVDSREPRLLDMALNRYSAGTVLDECPGWRGTNLRHLVVTPVCPGSSIDATPRQCSFVYPF